VEVIHAVDRWLGAVGAAVVSALVLAVLASAVKPVAPASWARTIDGSRTLTALGAVMPDELTRAASRLTASLDAAGVPRVFSGLTPEPLLPVEAPDAGATRTAAVLAASDSVVRVSSLGCGATQVGSGWVSSPGRVVTNAHVVAGGAEVSVEVAGTGSSRPATVVAFDPDLDLAVLRVDGLRAEPLPRAGALPDQSDVVVAGFPGGGAFEVSAGRVRGTIDAAGDDIYGGQGVTRQVYALWATVEQGNSGGPLLTPEGGVAGTVFARSMVDPFTAYALTDAQTAPVIEAAAGATAAVSTQECVRR